MDEALHSGLLHEEASQPGAGSLHQDALAIRRGVTRLLLGMGLAAVSEFQLPNGRRADVAALAPDGSLWLIEIKSSLADFRSDHKWPEYLDYCDRFYFAKAPELDEAIFPADHGLIVADTYGANILRESASRKLAGARRKSLLLAFALCASKRLNQMLDPEFDHRMIE
ncbi:MAG: MmcB family DNA repair protein [Alphaproteobacteria bacterium]|nr:MmcB family DNA repair protein [Alphaproteobacteria bacterium]